MTATGRSAFTEALPWSAISVITAFEALMLLLSFSIISVSINRRAVKAHILSAQSHSCYMGQLVT